MNKQEIKYLLSAVSTDKTRPHLGMLAEYDGYIRSTDGHRIHRVYRHDSAYRDWVCPPQAVQCLAALNPDNINPEKAGFSAGDVTVNDATETGDFPDVERCMWSQKPVISFEMDRKAAIKLLKNLTSPVAVFDFSAIEYSGAILGGVDYDEYMGDNNWAEHETRVDYSKPTVEMTAPKIEFDFFGVRRTYTCYKVKYLLDALSQGEKTVRFEFAAPNDLIRIVSGDYDAWIMPMRPGRNQDMRNKEE